MGLDARRLGIAEPHFVLQQFRHGRYALLVFLLGDGINVLRLPVAVFLRVVNFKIVLQLSGCVGILLVELFALQVEGVFGLLLVIFILPDFQKSGYVLTGQDTCCRTSCVFRLTYGRNA